MSSVSNSWEAQEAHLLIVFLRQATSAPINLPPSASMAGGALKYRHLNRTSSHRQALLRNLVTSLITHESIQTTWPKSKEAQRLAEKLITLGKKNTNASRAKAESIFYVRRIATYLPRLTSTDIHS